MRIKILLIPIVVLGTLSLFPSKSFSQTDNRAEVISKELDCVASREENGKIGWNDVCYSSSKKREETISKTMNQMIKEHQAMGDGMDADNATDSNDQETKTIDDLYQQENDHYGTTSADNSDYQDQPAEKNSDEIKTVDDLYKQENNYYRTTSADDSGNTVNEQDDPDQNQDQDQTPPPSNYENDSEKGGDTEDPYDTHRHEFDFGREDYYYRYEEDIPIYLRGWMHGYYGTYTYRPEEGSILNNNVTDTYKFEGHYARGDLDYTGSGKDNDITNKMYELRALVGKDYLLDDQSKVMPFVGLGYRYLMDRGGGRLTDTGFYGYNRESQYYYLPIGCTMDIPARNDWDIGLNVEYDFFIHGVQKSRLSDGDQYNGLGNDDLRNPQDKGFGLRTSVKFLKKTSMMNFYVEPFIRYWNIDQSKVRTGNVDGSLISGVEPKNNTMEIGSKIGLQF